MESNAQATTFSCRLLSFHIIHLKFYNKSISHDLSVIKTSAIYSLLYCASWILTCGCTRKSLPRALNNYESPWGTTCLFICLYESPWEHDLYFCLLIYLCLWFMTAVFSSFTFAFLKTSNLCLYVFQALKLSDELNLNEIECVRLLVDANREVWFAEFKFIALLLLAKFELLFDHLTCIMWWFFSGFCMVESHWKYIDLQLAYGTWREGIL